MRRPLPENPKKQSLSLVDTMAERYPLFVHVLRLPLCKHQLTIAVVVSILLHATTINTRKTGDAGDRGHGETRKEVMRQSTHNTMSLAIITSQSKTVLRSQSFTPSTSSLRYKKIHSFAPFEHHKSQTLPSASQSHKPSVPSHKHQASVI
jgi:hypothetical protein